ncbi:MAG TPA: hypothetical protein VFA79_09875 [Myxococcales bacterium]|nr:hypothetical protein [Myxococcales bacterium]
MAAGESGTSAPSLEQILWRAMDRFREEPALLDAEEFAEHIAQAFDAQVPEEAFADRFFAGVDRLHQHAAFALPTVPAARQPLHVYEFDLGRLEYVIVEDKDEVVVVSEFGQFKLENDDRLRHALEAAVVKKPERSGGEPRAYFVRASGEVLGVEAAIVARTFERMKLRQVSSPAVAAPGKRLASFNPRRRAMTASREQRVLEQRPLLELPPLLSSRFAEPPLAAPAIGAVTRWEQMVGGAPSPERQVMVNTGAVVAVVTIPGQELAGLRALAAGETLAAVRGGEVPVAALGSAAAGETFAPATRGADAPDRFWVQPENAWIAAPARTVVAHPLQLGEITGDPWSDWTLTAGAPHSQSPLPAALDPQPPFEEVAPAPPRAKRQPASEGAPIVAFRAPDGALVISRSAAPVRLSPSHPEGAPVALRARTNLVPKAGALPSVALRALHIALERTAAAGGYRLPAARLEAAPGVTRAFPLRPDKARRAVAHLAAPVSSRDHAARLLISMPFPNGGQLHVGEDLAEALHAYLAAPVMPLVVQTVSRAQRPGKRRVQKDAGQKGSRALVLVELPPARPLAAGAPSISDLPLLLRHAVAESRAWTARPGGSSPVAFREAAETPAFAEAAEARAKPRPPGPGEEEIVIPLPLWARLGRSPVTDSDLLFLSATPKGGEYRPVAPDDDPFDRAPGARSRTAEGMGPGGLLLPSSAGAAVAAARSHAPGLPPLDAAGAPVAATGGVRARDTVDLPSLEGAQAGFDAPETSWVAGVPGVKSSPPISTRRAPDGALPPGSAPSVEIGLPWLSSSGPFADPVAASREFRLGEAAQSHLAWSSGATLVSGLPRPLRQAPLSLRFRYVGSPFWWTAGSAAQVQQDLAAEVVAAARTGVAPASLAEAIRSASADDPLSIAQDRPVLVGMDAVAAASKAAAASPAIAAGPAFMVMSTRGTAGPAPAAAAARARAQAVDMSIVAAAPPAPPPLATTSSSASAAPGLSASGGSQATTRASRKQAEDAVSRSEIEGSVDAIAQRIYHRIRRRLQSDRERFGG